MQAKSSFTVDRFDQESPYFAEEGRAYARAAVDKTFTGPLAATGVVQMLSVRADEGPAGYVALERISGTLDGREGSFALLHIGTMDRDTKWAKWPIVPGSGTGELATIRGEGRIEIDGDGQHHLILDYEL
ncbi:MAG: DUF3224 domain-containing protein [Myxococcales bacterium FL481]|nr:MAG: DUF3224 domain-containing protein [Myxococcales bacterium FL481]